MQQTVWKSGWRSTDLASNVWRELLTKGELEHTRRTRQIFKFIPSDPRCAHCNRPFRGVGGMLVKWLWDIEPSKLNPRYCNDCEVFAKKHPGGAEVELAMLFIDIRGSTALAERLGTKEFTRLIDRFYTEISRVLIKSDALIEKLIGDEVAALFVPGYAGADYTARAIDAAKNALKVTGYFDRHGPWIRVGIGVHKGAAFVGSVGSSQGMIEIIALGDAVNIAARLCQAAKAGEIIVSDDACKAAGITCHNDSKRRLALKGRREEVDVCIQ